jgi:hypothetical protein
MGWRLWVALPGACIGAVAGIKVAGATTALGTLAAGAAGAAVGGVVLPLGVVAVAVASALVWTMLKRPRLFRGTIGKLAAIFKNEKNGRSVDELEYEFNKDREEMRILREQRQKNVANDFSQSATPAVQPAEENKRARTDGPKIIR